VSAAISSVLALATCSASAQTWAFECVATSATPGREHITIYVSQLLPMELSQRVALSGAWGEYVKANYHLDTVSSAVCQPFSMNPAYQQQALAAQQTAWKQQGWDVVHVIWKPGPSASPSSASDTSMYATAASRAGAAVSSPKGAEPAPTGPEPRASYCYSDDRRPNVYFSDPFDTAGLPAASRWPTAFNKMLVEKYGYKGTVTCKDAATFVGAQSAILEKKEGLQDKQVIDTDWTYEPPAAGDTPATSAPSH